MKHFLPINYWVVKYVFEARTGDWIENHIIVPKYYTF